MPERDEEEWVTTSEDEGSEILSQPSTCQADEIREMNNGTGLDYMAKLEGTRRSSASWGCSTRH